MSVFVLTLRPQCILCLSLGLVFSSLLCLLLEESKPQTGLHWHPPYLYKQKQVTNVKFCSAKLHCKWEELQESLVFNTVGSRVADNYMYSIEAEGPCGSSKAMYVLWVLNERMHIHTTQFGHIPVVCLLKEFFLRFIFHVRWVW